MKTVKNTLLALSLLAGMGMATNAIADGGFAESDFGSSYFLSMRPMMAKMNSTDRAKAMEMEAAIMKMEASHQMAMTKASMDHKMAIMKMRFDYEAFVQSRGAN